jgi:hypothetical protein
MVLIAAVAVTLVLVVDNGTRASSSGVASPQAAVRSDGGPDESTVASSVGSRPSAVPDESAIAASIGSASTPNAGGPDESTVAASISGP